MNTGMNRRGFLKTMGLGAAALALPRLAAAAPAGKAKRPNVVLVMTDDQGYGDLACLGNKIIKTPHIDKLHSQSVRLTDFHVAPTCSPTRAGLMTGRYCNRTGAWHTIMGRSMLRADEVTMGDVFTASGYATGAFGKWHLGDNYPLRAEDRGFGTTRMHGGGGVGQTPDYWDNNYFDDTYWENGKPTKFEGYCTDVFFDGALKFIETNRNRPFFCYLPTNAAHGPFLVAEKYKAMYADNPDVPNAAFYGMITNIDENMGRMMAKLDKLGLAENTILIFMTDNGTAGGFRKGKGFNAGMRGTKGSEYDGGHRVPCFVRWPAGGVTGGRDAAPLTANIDLLPTLIDVCGLKEPKGVEFDGASIATLLTGQGAADWSPRTLVVDSQRIEHPEKWRKSAVMTDRYRLINGKELYDIKADPGQATDIAAKHPAVVAALAKTYEAYWASTSKRFGEYVRTVLGSDKQNPTCLTCHDWHGRSVPWHQGAIRRGTNANGFWAVDVERAGTYEFTLRRWPEEIDKPINAAIDRGKAISVTAARMTIGDVDETRPVPANAVGVTFRVRLKAGKARLQTYFAGKTGQPRGAYFVYVRRLP